MILRRLSKHIKDQNWFAVVLDFVIVVAGILIAFQITSWADQQKRQRVETSYTERLHDEVVELQATREPVLEFRNRWEASFASTSALLFSNLERPMTEQECEGLAYSYIVSNPTDDIASLLELQQSGQLSLFQNKRVSNAIQAYFLTRARARDSQAGIARNMPIIASEYSKLVRLVSPSYGVSTGSEIGEYQCDAKSMKANQAFLNDYHITQSNYSYHVRDNIRVSNSLTELHRVLDDVLTVTHKETAP